MEIKMTNETVAIIMMLGIIGLMIGFIKKLNKENHS
jgi:hypothetical protein